MSKWGWCAPSRGLTAHLVKQRQCTGAAYRWAWAKPSGSIPVSRTRFNAALGLVPGFALAPEIAYRMAKALKQATFFLVRASLRSQAT